MLAINKVEQLVNSSAIVRIVVMKVKEVLVELLVADLLNEHIGQILNPIIIQGLYVQILFSSEIFVALYEVLKLLRSVGQKENVLHIGDKQNATAIIILYETFSYIKGLLESS